MKGGRAVKKFFCGLKDKTKNVWEKVISSLKTAFFNIGKFFKFLGAKIYSLYCKRPFVFCIVSALLMAFYIETVSRHSILEGLKFTFLSPVVFLYSALIILATMSLSLLIRRGIAMYVTVFLIWFFFGTANGVVLLNRPSPFAAADFLILPTVLGIITVYLTVFEIIIISIALVAAVTGIVFMWIKAPKRDVCIKKDLVKFLSSALLIAVTTMPLLSLGVLTRDYSDILKAYEKNGFPYSFARSLFCSDIPKPSGYSEKKINGVLDRIDAKKQKNEDFSAPNIIYVQLESFIDLSHVKGVTLSENPTPNFTALKESCPSGFLSVPLVGSGTANTEFEILTGMSTEFFSPGEYPYITIMRETVCESTPFILSKNGYKTHAMHNNTGVFYDRHLVYPNLGFDTFIPIEHMYDVEYNDCGWAKDASLLYEIQRTLESTAEKDFVFTVSVQPHGSYPTEKLGDYSIKVSGFEDNPEFENMYTYYAEQIKGTDKLIGDLVDYYKDYHEDTVIVFYGDHLPDLRLTEDDLKEGNRYQTEYVLWSNFGAFDNVPNKDIESFQLGAYLYELLGLNENIGVIGAANRYMSNETDYKDILHLLEYDALFGKNYSNKGAEYKPTTLSFGAVEIKITDLAFDSGTLTVSGEWFNPFSVIYINGERVEAEYVSREKIVAKGVELKDGDMVTVKQDTEDGDTLSTSVAVAYVQGK